MSFGYVDRLPMIEFAPYWDKTLHRWYDEGLDRKLNDDVEIRKSFGLDTYRQFWFTPKPKNVLSHYITVLRYPYRPKGSKTTSERFT